LKTPGADAPPQPERVQLKASYSFWSPSGGFYVPVKHRRMAAQYQVTDFDTLAVVLGTRSPAFVPVFLLTFTMHFFVWQGHHC